MLQVSNRHMLKAVVSVFCLFAGTFAINLLLAFFLICGTAQASEGSWQVTDEEVCRKYEPSIPLDVCMAEQKAAGVRALEVESQCTAAFPNDVKANTDCREICWARKDDAASCALEATALIEKYREEDRAVKDADRHRMIVIGVLSTIVLVIVLLLIVKRTRSAIGSFIARGIYAVSGFDVRKISERWDGYRRRDQDDSNQQAAESTVVSVSAAAPIPGEQTGMKKRGSSLVLLNIGRVLMWMWIINGVGHLLLGPPLIGPIQQPIYAFACLIQIVAAIIFLYLMTKAVRRRKHTSVAASS
jgi:hypothetical protein